MEPSIAQSVALYASPEKIWHALTDPEDLAHWWSEGVVIEPIIGGLFKEPWIDSEGQEQLTTGKVLSVIPKRELIFTVHEKEWPPEWDTECTFKIEDRGEERILTLHHDGWEHFPEEKRENLMKDFELGWVAHLKGLKEFVG